MKEWIKENNDGKNRDGKNRDEKKYFKFLIYF